VIRWRLQVQGRALKVVKDLKNLKNLAQVLAEGVAEYFQEELQVLEVLVEVLLGISVLHH
jgi:hypothetical protein